MSYVLGKNAYFSQEDRHKQGEPFFCLVFKSFHILKCDIMHTKHDSLVFLFEQSEANFNIFHQILSVISEIFVRKVNSYKEKSIESCSFFLQVLYWLFVHLS